MNQHRYILQPYKGLSTRYACPSCENPKQFSRYLDTETGELLPEYVGRCNREANCGYHYTPRQYFEDNAKELALSPNKYILQRPKPIVSQPNKQPSYIPFELFHKSLKNYHENEFTKGLHSLFNDEITNDLISRFYIGTSKHWPGATVFWQIDQLGRIRTGKVMLYDSSTIKRIKQPFNHIDWVHSILKKQKQLGEFTLSQCLFGLHQLTSEPIDKPIAIVESEKTAVLATVYLPEYVWLACGSLTNLTTDKLLPIAGRPVTLFPDLNCFDKWSQKADELRPIIGQQLKVSAILEKQANTSDRQKGYDIADYLITKRDTYTGWALTDFDYPVFWDYKSTANNTETATIKSQTVVNLNTPAHNMPPSIKLPLTLTERTLQRMNARNPILQELIKTLDLVNPKTGEPFRTYRDRIV